MCAFACDYERKYEWNFVQCDRRLFTLCFGGRLKNMRDFIRMAYKTGL